LLEYRSEPEPNVIDRTDLELLESQLEHSPTDSVKRNNEINDNLNRSVSARKLETYGFHKGHQWNHSDSYILPGKADRKHIFHCSDIEDYIYQIAGQSRNHLHILKIQKTVWSSCRKLVQS
jgi:hypothetical protein